MHITSHTEPQATEYHTQSTRVQHRNCESGLWLAISCTQAGPADTVEMAWTDESTLGIIFDVRHCCHHRGGRLFLVCVCELF